MSRFAIRAAVTAAAVGAALTAALVAAPAAQAWPCYGVIAPGGTTVYYCRAS